MPRKPRRLIKMKQLPISKSLKHYLLTGNYGAAACPGCLERGETFLLANPGKRDGLRAIWESNKNKIITDWIKKTPCTRPWAFWEFDVKEIRRRIGGIGDLFHDWGDYTPHECYFGIPGAWVSAFDEAYYNGKALDVFGKVIPSPFKDGDFQKTAYDPNDLPVFESEAAHLERHGFLTTTEKTYLKKYPELMEPEKIEFDDDEDE